MKVIVVIPARYESSRFPGKPLAMILDKPMIQWVYEGVSRAKCIDQTYVATDDKRIFDCVLSFGGQAVMTGQCRCGTDRVYEVAKNINCDAVINVQGDEPLVRADDIDALVNIFHQEKNTQMVTLINQINDDKDIDDPNNVKAVIDLLGNALYFSRSRIPYCGRNDDITPYYKHIGIYGYRKGFLEKFVQLDESPNERVEKLEQMRALDNGFRIRTIKTDYRSIGVDSPEDLKQVERAIMSGILGGVLQAIIFSNIPRKAAAI